MKVFLFSLFLVVTLVSVCTANSRLGVEPKRLYEYIDLNNRTVREWLTLSQILETVAECGKIDQSRAQAHGGFFDVTDHQDVKPSPVVIPSEGYPTELKYQQRVGAWVDQINMKYVTDHITDLGKFFTRYYTTDTGVKAAAEIRAKFQAIITQRGTSRCSVTYFDHTWAQPSVVATIAGRSPDVVIVGAHEDSIRSGAATGEAPGADDDASGTATVIETFRIICEDLGFVPAKTLEFHTYAAEEVGLRGSQAMATYYQSRGIKVAGMMQLDMTGYKNGAPAIMNDYVNKPLTDLLFKIAENYAPPPPPDSKWVVTTCGYACSDHASWDRSGFPAVLPSEATMAKSNPNIHTIRDTLSLLNTPHMKLFVQLALGWCAELAGSTTE